MTDNQTIENPQNHNPETKKKSYTVLWIMIFLFVLPYIAAFYFYFNRDELDLGQASNYGTIISPARHVEDIQLTQIDGSNTTFSSLKGKWVLFSIASSQCQQDCIDNLYKIRQIKKAVGQEHKRIQKAFFLLDKTNIESFKTTLNDYPDMNVFVPSDNSYNEFLSKFSIPDINIIDSIFVVDPLGNYMMIYPRGSDPSKILKDIERLLKVSKIG